MTILLSPLRYPGSKIRVVDYMSKVLDFNGFRADILVEPFVGGGSVFLNFLANDWAKRVIIGDKDRLIFSFWKTLFGDTRYLINFIRKVNINLREFKYYKQITVNQSEYEEKKLAEACLFLNRTSYSGLLTDDVGPIGGKLQKSEYKIDCRFNRKTLIERIEEIAKFKPKVKVLPYDWERTIDYALEKSKEAKLLFYLDPPFYLKGHLLYRCYFENGEHYELSEKIKSLKFKWILSYDKGPEIRKMYSEFIKKGLAFPYSLNSSARRIETEYFITCKDFQLPPERFLTK